MKLTKTQFKELMKEFESMGLVIDTNPVVSKHIMMHEHIKGANVRAMAIKAKNGGSNLIANQVEYLKKYNRQYCENLGLSFFVFEVVV